MKKNVANKPFSREEILDAIRAEAKQMDGTGIRMKNVLERVKTDRYEIRRLFGGWRNAITAAGLDSRLYTGYIEGDELLSDWGTVALKLKRAPSYTYYNEHGKYSATTFQDRFGSWLNVRQAFRVFAKGKSEWAEVVKFCEPDPRTRRVGVRRQVPIPRRKMRRRRNSAGRPRDDRPAFGEPLDNVPGLLNAPLTENGVILTFGMVAERLGFQIRAVRPAFPDCIAMRWVGGGTWQEVTIEFELESKNFRAHRHPPDGCDILVCWTHNWEDCPPNIEVIALSEELERLREVDG